MPDVQHNALTGAELHEPKGISGAVSNQTYVADGAGGGAWSEPEPKGAGSAQNKQVFMADGAGSGAWIYWPTGWEFVSDDASGQTFNTTAAKLSIDGAGSASEADFLPPEIRGSGNLWDTTLDKMTPIAAGDAYEIRLDLPITAKTGSPNRIDLEFDISGLATPSTVIITREITTTGTTPFTVSIGFPLFVGTTFLSNGGQVFLTTDTGSVTITAPSITIVRLHSGAI